jgi:Rne/Rng family ribonuclease
MARLEKGTVVELDFEIPGTPPSLLGGIYLGKVVEIQKPLHAAFVDIGLSQPGILPLKEGKLPTVTHGATVLVQVSRTANPLEHKGVRLTRLVSISLGPLFYTPFRSGLSLSRKIKDRQAFEKLFSLQPDEGLIVRHHAIPTDPLVDLLMQLRQEWASLQPYMSQKAPVCIFPPPSLLNRVLRSMGHSDHLKIDNLQANVLTKGRGSFSRTKAFDERCEEAWESLSSPEIPLFQGGSLFIEETRGLVVIDVNSQGALRNINSFNREAIKEALHQIRLRELGGKIVIDLIDAPRNLDPLLQGLNISSDVEIFGLSPLHLLEMIRRRRRLSLPHRLNLQLN